MASAQILLLVRGTAEISAEEFRNAVADAAQAQGLTPSAWTYDAVSATAQMPAGASTESVVGGPWAGVVLGSVVPTPAVGSVRVVLSSFRQNLAGLSENVAEADAQLSAVSSAVRASLAGTGRGVKSAFKTLRNAISWDRGIPTRLELGASGSGPGMGWAVVASLGVLAIIVARGGKSSSSSSSTPPRLRPTIEMRRGLRGLRRRYRRARRRAY